MADKKPDLAAGIPSHQLSDDAIVTGTVDGNPVILVRHGGKICALSGECTHLGAPLETGIVTEGELRCPWHHARFALETGEAVGAPAIEQLSCYDVAEDGDLVRVTRKRQAGKQAGVSNTHGGPIVIVGGGAAGHACADMLARAGQGSRVTVLSADTDAPYDRTFCSKQYLAGKKQRDDCALPEPGMGQATVAVRTGVTVDRINPDRRMVITSAGEHILYETLILATGAEPILPEIAGFERSNVHLLRSLADADALIEAAGKAKHVAIMGASFIGLEVAASLVQRGLPVTVIAQDEVPLAAVIGAEAGRFVQSLHEEKGVLFHLGRTIASYNGKAVTLDNGVAVEADLLVVGAGVKPRIDLAAAAGMALAADDEGGGIRVDGSMATSIENIYAIGDVANYPDPRLGHHIRVEHWVHAQRQGQYLARRLLGETAEEFGDTPFFWSGHYDASLRYVGHVASPEDRRVEGTVEKGEFALFFREEGRDQALLTCKRDIESLDVEARWDEAASA